MAQAIGTIKLVNAFSDDSTRSLEITGLDPTTESFAGVKTRIKALNADPSAIASLYLSDDSGSFTAVTAATLTEVVTREFNLNDVESEEDDNEGGED